jgi:ankyrin repeat protein
VKRPVLLSFSILVLILAFQQRSELHADSQAAKQSGGNKPGRPEPHKSAAKSGHLEALKPVQAAELRAASGKAIGLIQQSQVVWSKKESCASCHHQLLPEIPIRLARERGVPVDEKVAHETTANAFGYLKDLDSAQQGYDYIDVLADGWALVAARVAGVKPSLTTSASAQFIASRQLPDGSWPTVDVRPPQSHSLFTTTAVCAQAVRNYLPAQFKNEAQARVARARQWLIKARPHTTEDCVFQLLGLYWTGADKVARSNAAQQLLRQQREDGGWSQLPALASDAYATGEVLAALNEAAGLSTSDPAYQRGLRFLLGTQESDGSWRVNSRLHPPAPVSPPYFETGFPYGHNQFSSVMGTSWAAAALLRALPVKAGQRLKQPSLDIATAERAEWIQVALNGTAADLKKLLDGGMNPGSKTAAGTTALMFAARDPEKVKLLIDRGADVNARAANGINALMIAARYRGNAQVVSLLLKSGAKPNAEKGVEIRNDASALYFAVMAGDAKTIGVLLDAGARLGDRMKILGRFATSPLLYATFTGDPDLVEYLISKGANPNEVDDDGISMLGWAAVANHARTVQTLISRGAQVNTVDKYGMTPLLYATSIDYGDTVVLEKLIAAGADRSIKTKEGLTALELAKSYRHQSQADLLSGKTSTLR